MIDYLPSTATKHHRFLSIIINSSIVHYLFLTTLNSITRHGWFITKELETNCLTPKHK